MSARALSMAILIAAASMLASASAQQPGQKSPADIVVEAPAEAWRPIDPENTLMVDLPAGPVVIELRPDFAPAHVEQIKTLARRGFYNNLNFHRVIEGFAAQGGDPKGDGTGGSDLPNIEPEFERDSAKVEGFTVIGRDRVAARVGFVDGMPVAAEPESMRAFVNTRNVGVWGAHCPGVMSMARGTHPASANSQFFIVIGDARSSLDRRYSVWGWIVSGYENTRRIVRGEPPSRPTPIVRMRIAADIPAAQRPKVEVMRTDSQAFQDYIKAAGYVREDGFVRNLCGVKPPRRIDGKIFLE